MNWLVGYCREKLGQTIHKVIFIKPFGDDKFIEIKQVYVSPSQTTVKLDKKHEYPFNAADWVRQRGNRFLQYKDYEALQDYGFYTAKQVQLPAIGMSQGKLTVFPKPSGKIMLSVEFAAAKGAEVAKAVLAGGQLQAGLVLCILCVAVGAVSGVLVGYFGFPAIMGQHLVQNAVAVAPK